MIDVDRRSFVAGIGIGTLPVSVTDPLRMRGATTEIADHIEKRLALSAQTVAAMTSRARRFVSGSGDLLVGSSDGRTVELAHDSRFKGSWLLRGVPESHEILAGATAFLCDRAIDRLFGLSASFRWYSGCCFGGAAGNLFRGAKSSVFLVTRALPANVVPRRLDIVMA